jgi:dTDP-4-dehydrorhamnose reductase
VSAEIWGLYHVSAAGETTWCGLAREVFRVADRLGGRVARVRPIATRDYPTPALRPADSRLDAGKLKRVFGIELPSWPEGVEQCVTDLSRQARGPRPEGVA